MPQYPDPIHTVPVRCSWLALPPRVLLLTHAVCVGLPCRSAIQASQLQQQHAEDVQRVSQGSAAAMESMAEEHGQQVGITQSRRHVLSNVGPAQLACRLIQFLGFHNKFENIKEADKKAT